MPHDPVVIVGAGMAGLACAHAFRRAGVPVRILEARNRVGGRVWTDREFAGAFPVEAGALMVHGKRVSVQDWIAEYGVETRPLPRLGTRISHAGRLWRTSTMVLPGNHPFGARTSFDAFWRLPRDLARYRGPECSLQEFLDRRSTAPAARLIANFFYAHAAAADPWELNVKGTAEEMRLSTSEFPWRNYQVMPGFDRLASLRAGELQDSLRLGARVLRVDLRGAGVELTVAGAEGRAEVVRAPAAVITVPLGVLRSESLEFDPPLPAEKLKAIHALGNGAGFITLLRFREAFWRGQLGEFVFFGADSATFYFRPLYRLRDAPAVLLAFTTGREAARLSSLPPREVVAAVLDEFARLVPGVRPHEHLIEGRVVNWQEDPLSLGAYSFLTLGSDLRTRQALATPIDGRIFFAGEATNYAGEAQTVHGAIDSGVRAAGEVVAALRAGRS